MSLTAFAAILVRELRLSLRHGADTLAAVLFFLVAAALFPLAIGPAPETLGRIAPGIVWVCALLAALPGHLAGLAAPGCRAVSGAAGPAWPGGW